MKPIRVRCCLCDHQWYAAQKGVLYRSADRKWWCANEIECRRRRAVLLARMQLALNTVWQLIDAAAES